MTLVLDIDLANSPTYGNQYGRPYKPHYEENGYHPLFTFEVGAGDCLKDSLRAGHVCTSRQVVFIVDSELKRLK